MNAIFLLDKEIVYSLIFVLNVFFQKKKYLSQLIIIAVLWIY